MKQVINHQQGRTPAAGWKKLIKIVSLGLLLFVALLSLPSLAGDTSSQLQILDQESQSISPSQSPAPPAPTASGINDPQEFANFVDRFFVQEMPKTHIPGAVISVVKDGQLLFAKGYGYGNVKQKIPVDAQKTLFRVASLSKLMTATAAMQLYESGKLDLNGSVNQYLPGWQLENPFPQSVQVAQLMTHTDGSTKRLLGIAAPTAAEMEPLGNYLHDHTPAIVYPPGKLYSYSSHATALLGYIAERVAGLPLIQYIDQNIFKPLEMQRSTFLQPPPPSLVNDLATGYQYQNGKYQAVPFLYLNIAPAAAMSTTAIDMAHFMIAHLQLGRYQNARILQPDTARLMHRQHFTFHPLVPGTGYSFRERLENNLRAIGHLGNLRGYSSSLTLLPDQQIGIFVATNSFSGIHGKFLTQFFDRYFPVAQEQRLPELPLSPEQLQRFTGTYRDLEYPRDTFLKLAATFEHINITTDHQGGLLVRTPALFFMGNPNQLRLRPVGERLFQRANDDALVAFGKDSMGKIQYAYSPIYPKIGAYLRVPWYETVWVQVGLLVFCIPSFLSAMIAWPIWPLIQRFRGRSIRTRSISAWAWMTAGLVGLLNLLFLIGLPLYLWWMGAWKLAYGVTPVVVAFLCLPLVTMLLTIGLIWFTSVAWKKSNGSLLKRLHYSLVTVSSLVFLIVLRHWNLLGFHF